MNDLAEIRATIGTPRKRPRSRTKRLAGAPGNALERGPGGVHQAIINLMERAYPQAWCRSIRNEAGRKMRKAGSMQLHADGVRAGTPDIATCWAGGVIVWLEVKRELGGRTSDAQDQTHARLRQLGFRVAVVRSVDEAVAAFRQAGVIG